MKTWNEAIEEIQNAIVGQDTNQDGSLTINDLSMSLAHELARYLYTEFDVMVSIKNQGEKGWSLNIEPIEGVDE